MAIDILITLNVRSQLVPLNKAQDKYEAKNRDQSDKDRLFSVVADIPRLLFEFCVVHSDCVCLRVGL